VSELGLRFHHLGLAVKAPRPAEVFLRAQGYALGAWVHDPVQRVDLSFCIHPAEPAVEVICPSKGDEDGPLRTILRTSDSLIYHACYQTGDLDGTLRAIHAQGLRALPVSTRKPAVLFGGKEVSFYMVQGIGLVEFLCE
jgi:methylmalonyl-CoA/ethylmalonyl-CoA epimerase